MGNSDVNVMAGTKVPALRFKGFSDEWVEKKLGDLLSYEQPTKYIVESDAYDDSYDLPVLTAGKSFILGYTDETEGVYDKGEVILFDDFTTATQFVDFDFKVKSSAMKLLTPIDNNNITFLYESLNRIQYPHDDHKRYWISEFATLKSLTPKDVMEQHQIGQLFKTADSLIKSEEQKLEQLQSLKKSFLQKMFPKKGTTAPELRFDGFSGDWTEKKLGDVSIVKSSPLKASDVSSDTTQYPVYDANNVIGYHESYIMDQPYITIIKDGAGVGRVRLLPEYSHFTGTMNAIIPNEDVDLRFLYERINQIKFDKYKVGSTIPHVYYRDYSVEKLRVPELPEQVAIGQFFKTFDELIVKQEEKVENGKLLKKALLQKMFV